MATGTCDHCLKEFSYQLIHNGFNDSAYAYCDRCSYTVILSGWYAPLRKLKHPVHFHKRISPDVEPLLRPCPCGGTFRHSADPKCPHCSEPLSPDKAANFIEKNAPGTAKGWRWQRSWDGINSIVIESHGVKDWWDEQQLAKLPKARQLER